MPRIMIQINLLGAYGTGLHARNDEHLVFGFKEPRQMAMEAPPIQGHLGNVGLNVVFAGNRRPLP
jgi:hypothetical protein